MLHFSVGGDFRPFAALWCTGVGRWHGNCAGFVKMKWFVSCIIVGLTINGGGGVTQPSGVSQFWTDDYKVFENIYGKTSDKDIYGATLPPTFAFGIDTGKLKNIEASEKKEKLYDEEGTSASDDQADAGYNVNYNGEYDAKYNTGYDTKYSGQNDPYDTKYSGQNDPYDTKYSYSGQNDPYDTKYSGQNEPYDTKYLGQNEPYDIKYAGQNDPYFKPEGDIKQITGYDTKFKKTEQYFRPNDNLKFSTGYVNKYTKQQVDPYDTYAALVAKQQLLKSLQKQTVQSTKPTFKFLSHGDFKPISQSNDPQTYNYYKNLEALEKQQSIGFPKQGIKGFKPYTAEGVTNPENIDAYRSIQDIIDARENNKPKKASRPKYPEKDDVQYITYGNARSKKPLRLIQGNDITKSYNRCGSGGTGRCRKRSPTRVRSRPVLIKHFHTGD